MKKKISLLMALVLMANFAQPVQAAECCELKYNEANEIINLEEYEACLLRHSIETRAIENNRWDK